MFLRRLAARLFFLSVLLLSIKYADAQCPLMTRKYLTADTVCGCGSTPFSLTSVPDSASVIFDIGTVNNRQQGCVIFDDGQYPNGRFDLITFTDTSVRSGQIEVRDGHGELFCRHQFAVKPCNGLWVAFSPDTHAVKFANANIFQFLSVKDLQLSPRLWLTSPDMLGGTLVSGDITLARKDGTWNGPYSIDETMCGSPFVSFAASPPHPKNFPELFQNLHLKAGDKIFVDNIKVKFTQDQRIRSVGGLTVLITD